MQGDAAWADASFFALSGTSGYVVRNLSHLRSHDNAADRAAMDSGPMKHREPDKEILEHERKRKIEVACCDLRIKLEEDGLVALFALQWP
jgi:hypothetical protein